MHRNKSVNVHQFAMVPKADIPRSKFIRQQAHKTTFDDDYLVPIFVDEILPGDTHSLKMTAFARMATPIYPVMDNLYLDSFFFFVPNRLVWTHWVNFLGEQANPSDSISYTIPVCTFTAAAPYAVQSLQDYMGLPTTGQFVTGTWSHNNLPMRCYNLIWNQWFRDENLQTSLTVDTGDGPDTATNYTLQKRGKRHDYFTSCLPWTQKGGTPVTLPLGTSAPIRGLGFPAGANAASAQAFIDGSNHTIPTGTFGILTGGASSFFVQDAINSTGTFGTAGHGPGLYADLSQATAATINQIRQAFQIQRLLERDARSGTRHVELLRAHFGVVLDDYRAQRPVYLGGGTSPINITPIAQTSGTSATGTTTPLGQLASFGTGLAQNHGFTQSFQEHGYIIGLIHVRADQSYQQGLRKMWSRSTRYDFYWPAFAALGEQAVLNQEIFIQGIPATDTSVFGYNERWSEYRYLPSMITGQFKSTTATPLDAWHLAEKFTTLPTLGATFITSNAPVDRVIAVPSQPHFIVDTFFNIKSTRAMPMYSVPGLIDHF